MPDVTPLFKRYVGVFLEDSVVGTRAEGSVYSKPSRKYLVQDTFVKECLDLLKHILELQKVVSSIKSQYESESELSEREKNDFDTEVRLLIQQYFDKLKFLEKYEKKRQDVIQRQYFGDSEGDLMSLFRHRDEGLALFHSTNNKHRSGILQSLSMILSSIFSGISRMQQQRLLRQKELESIDFNAQLYNPIQSMVASVSQSPPIETTEEEVQQYEETIGKLSQQQLQILETEHDELLNIKKQELQKVENLSKTMVQITSLQNEIGTHLQSQTQNIFTLLDNHDDVELDIKQGNRQLKKAQKRSGKSAKLIIYLSIFFGILILCLDFIN
ncbi:LANO_0H24080g1_1 [Lachancea nothofagi CBS 11611]|uniref:LANO_0H24080g1_1 n=1 Tax=Lachancea nothofagi CBS 11611 TaxID=1266666 RepID=A0A1G4KNP8_9SACH|nr:LANO_0H24080g1_1 [Lachancea nothofagi CBS 11611]